jgi:predicted nucleic acid-binding protein
VAAFYLDASIAIKAYSEEPGADCVEEVLDSRADIYLSRVGVVEVAAAFFGKTKTGVMQVEEAVSALKEFRLDVDSVYRVIEVGAVTSDRAIEVAKNHHLRAYDCLQLATALLLQEQRDALGLAPLTFASSDRELVAAARVEGLTVEDPAV